MSAFESNNWDYPNVDFKNDTGTIRLVSSTTRNCCLKFEIMILITS